MTPPTPTILIVDHDPLDRQLLEAQVRPEGYATISVASGAEALVAIATQAPDLILLDATMPAMDGYHVARTLKADPGTSNIPIIMVTPAAKRGDRLAALDAGAEDVVARPVDGVELRLRLRNLLRLKALSDSFQRHGATMERLVQTQTLDLQRFRTTMDATADSFMLVDRTTMGFVEVNAAAAKMLGYTREELFQMGPAQLRGTAPDELEGEYDAIIAHPDGEEITHAKIRRKDGSYAELEVRRQAQRHGGRWIIVGVVRDVTEREKADRRFKDLLESTVDAMVIVNADGEIVQLNAHAVDLFGWTREQLLGKNVDLLVPERLRGAHPASRAGFMQQSRARSVGEGSELFGLRRDGTEFPVEISLNPLETGERTLVVSTIRDITTRTEAARNLRESERRFRDMLGNARLLSVMLDRDGNITYCNEFLLCLTDWQLSDVIGRNWFDIFVPPECGDLRDLFASLIHDQSTLRHHENEILTRSGERRLIRWNNSILRSGAGSVIGSASIGEDVTEQRQSEMRIKQLNRVHAVLSAINTMMLRALDRDELFKEACRIAVEQGGFRMSLIAILEPNAMQIVPVASAGKDEELMVAIRGMLSSSESAPRTMVARAMREKTVVLSNDSQSDPRVLFGRKYSESGVRSIAVLPLIVGDEAVGVLALYASERAFFGDDELTLLTELTDNISFALERQREVARNVDMERARNDANAANRAKSNFLAAMSHEIRTPMNGVIGMVDLLDQTRLESDQADMVRLIRESAFSLLKIIDDILDFSKIEAGRLEVESVPISVAGVVENACDMLDHLSIKSGGELFLFIDPTLPEQVFGDGLRLRQVLLNIIGNAIKFSANRIDAGQVSVRVMSTGRASRYVGVSISVADNGIGMDEITQSRIFTAFGQGDTSTTRRFGGTGLGLVISRHLIELMGGSLTLRTKPDQGCTFTVELQLALPHEEAPVMEPAVPLAGLSCLVIGTMGGRADDIAVYLAHDGARVERAPDLAAVRSMMTGMPAGEWVWLVATSHDAAALKDLHELACSLTGQRIHFVDIGRGSRRAQVAGPIHVVLTDDNVLTRRRLLKAVALAAGRTLAEEPASPTLVQPLRYNLPTREDALRDGRLILVAEDNETNQKVIMRQLALLGFAAELADNGAAALLRWQTGDYVLLLTDLHMPEMDGYELTAAIRAREAGSPRMPIVALTANALRGESDRCRAAGMDDYLSKPLQLADLKATMDRWLPAARSDSQTQGMATLTAAAAGPVDVSVLAALIGDEPAIIREFLNDFQISAANIALQLKIACRDNHSKAASEQAHKLKSAARTVGALALGEFCQALETAGDAGNGESLGALWPAFEKEFTAVNAYLDSLSTSPAQ